MLSDEEINQRTPIWVVFSDLFLDTDVAIYYPEIIRECAASDFSILELESILKHEVAPVLTSNLLSVAGEWEGFDKEWLVREINNQLKKTNRLRQFMRWCGDKASIQKMLDREWQVLSSKIEEQREDA